MDQTGLKEYIKSSDYFKDARAWYNDKYLLPLSHRTWLIYTTLLGTLMIVALTININKLLPIMQTLTYAISIDSTSVDGETNARVVEMDDPRYLDKPKRFIAGNLLESYIVNRENFNYINLEKQFDYVRNTSTRLVYRRFYNYMSVNNPDSPVMRYQQYGKRTVKINDIKFISDNEATIYFTSTARDSSNDVFENLDWSAQVTFEMGDVGRRLEGGSIFKFTVTNYNLKLLGEAK